jgi:hypothetical protein
MSRLLLLDVRPRDRASGEIPLVVPVPAARLVPMSSNGFGRLHAGLDLNPADGDQDADPGTAAQERGARVAAAVGG